MKSITIEHYIEKSQEGRYYGIPFTVPEGIEQLTVSYSYPKGSVEPANVVDLGLTDAKGRFLGWSGSARNTISVGPFESTPGYWMTDIMPGSWQILVGAYKIPEEGLTVQYEITFSEPQPRWLAGDLHMHSTASDGEHSAYELALNAQKEGLDFIAITDHNNYCGNFNPPSLPGLTILPGTEWTHYNGHVNFFGVKAPFENSFIANSEEEMLELISQVKKNGALVSVNHPKCPNCPCLWKDDQFFDMMEIWNGPMRKANMDAARWWHEQLLSGRKLPIVGGSDFHREKSPVRQGHPVTFVYAKSPAGKDILQALSQGHSFITTSTRGVKLDMHTDNIMFGDTIPSHPGRLLHFSAKNGHPGMRLQLVTDRGIAAEEIFRSSSETLDLCVPERNWRFAYLRAYYRFGKKVLLCAISNPVYFERSGQ